MDIKNALQDALSQCFASALLLQEGALSSESLAHVQKIKDIMAYAEHAREQICMLILQVANEKLAQDAASMADICTAQGSPFLCHKGCVSCCHHLVMCEEIEARCIAAYLANNAQAKDVFLQNYALWDQKTVSFRTSYMLWAQDFYGKGQDSGAHTLNDYAFACPLLDAKGLCTAYEVRPYACRSTVSVNALCADTAGGFGGKYTMQYSLYTGHHLMRKALMQLCEPAQTTKKLLAMPEMVHALL